MNKPVTRDVIAILDDLCGRREFMKLCGSGLGYTVLATVLPGLADQNLEMGEDLKITIDLRMVLAELLVTRLGCTDLNAAFPGFTGPTSANLFL
jgi:hypothetical protein